MAAPSPTARGTPGGIMLDDGYSTLITIVPLNVAAGSTVSFWEKTVKPPGMDGGEAIDQTTMHNDTWRVFRARALKTLTDSSGKAGYDPDIMSDISAMVNVEGTITVTFPDGTTWAFFGFLRTVEFDELAEGTLPELTYTITATNWDPTNRVEAGPAVASVAGT